MDAQRTLTLIDELLQQPAESGWVEFKENDSNPEAIGKYISALANSARLADKPFAYLLWGIRDGDRSVVGTHFEPTAQRHKGQPLELWLAQFLQPAIHCTFQTVDYRGVRLVMLEIPAATHSQVEFNQLAYIRVGSATPKLSDHPEKLQALWRKLQPYRWESGVAASFVSGDDVLARLDYASYFSLTDQRLPDNRAGIFEKLQADRIIGRDVGERWNITNLGAILFARQLSDFDMPVARKAIRFVAYDGTGRTSTITHRLESQKGYANAFPELIDHIHALIGAPETISKALRKVQTTYPSLAIRELVANALIHQDMSVSGTGPLIELFRDRMEITNPGVPLIQPERFLDYPPQSRNEALAALMRRMSYCEEQGTGIDKVIHEVERYRLPPPDFQQREHAMRVVLYAPRRFADMTPQERVRACYQHAAFMHVNGERMKNASLRERLGIEARNAAQASTVISQALKEELIRPADPEHPRIGYLPYWA
ncbi:MAG: ATP-binding protein [Lautropia sp.]|nr:ATP-binding protein [Lautropia sp.]